MMVEDSRALMEFASRAVRYDAASGKLFWLPKESDDTYAKRWNKRYAGKECGLTDKDGYRRLSIKMTGKEFRIPVHRLIWFIEHGEVAKGEIDHINQDASDNRPSNLRDVSCSVNQRNRTRNINNKSGVTGVFWNKHRSKWYAQAQLNGKHRHIGAFDDISQAEAAVKRFHIENGFTDTHGREAARKVREIEDGAV
jgi:hypothetical protein